MPPRSAEDSSADLEACKALLRRGSKSFAMASLLLPRRARDPAAALYAFCRVLDDEVDVGSADEATVDRLHDRLARAFEGRPHDSPVDRALAEVAAAHGIPRALLDAMLEGFAWDARGRRYETLPDLEAYAARVAATVGVMMTILMAAPARPEQLPPEMLARACDLGVAMQLTNIARDVGEDARAGRIYLPLAWLGEAGIDPAELVSRPVMSPALGGVIARLLGAADRLYERADAGIPMLPADCRWAIRAARQIYAEIGRDVARAGFDSVSRRAHVGAPRKLWLVMRAHGLWQSSAIHPGAQLPPSEATRFVVEAARLSEEVGADRATPRSTAPAVAARSSGAAGARGEVRR
jgi:phytoene synthase